MKQRPSSYQPVLLLPRYIAVACAGVCLNATTANAADVGTLEEVIVTAQKRSERLLDVPISIEAVTSDEIDRRGLVNSEDYLRGMPAVNQVVTFVGPSTVIRGIETSSGGNGLLGSTVATYFGETPTTTSASMTGQTTIDLKLVDIERVEVLRGPQGTAFGSSSLGGAVRTIPVSPNPNELEGKVKTGYSVTSGSGDDNYTVQGALNIPLVEDKLAVRAVGYWFNDHGYIRNVAGSDAAFQAYSATYGVQSFAVDDDNVGASRVKGGRIAGSIQATKNLKFTLNYITQRGEIDSGWRNQGTDGLVTESHATIRGYEQAMWQVAPQHVIRGEKAGMLDTDIDISNATIEYQAGWASVLGTFSHLESGTTNALPFDVLGMPFSQKGIGTHKENTGEIRLVTQLSGPLDFLAGIYAEELEDAAIWDYYWFGDLATMPDFWASPSPDPFLGYFATARKTKQKAAFAEATWEFAPKFALTGGGRAYEYDRTVANSSAGPLFGDSDTHMNTDASGTNYRANLSYKPSDTAHIYLGFSQGFRMGLPQQGLAPSVCDRNGDGIVDGTPNVTMESTKVLQADSVDSYELGTKLSLMNRRVMIDGAIFNIYWDGVPFGVNAPPLSEGGCGVGYQANAGKAQSRGVELEVNWQLTDAVRVNVGGSYVDAEFREDVPLLATPDIKGVRVPGAPRVNGSVGLQYDFSIGGYAAFVRTDSIYVGEFYTTIKPDDATRAGDYVKVDATARVTLNKLSLELFVRNLTNEDAFTFRGPADAGVMYGYPMRPRTIGMNLGYDF